jgi:hypothetical protein
VVGRVLDEPACAPEPPAWFAVMEASLVSGRLRRGSSSVLMFFSLMGVIALFSGLGPGNWPKMFWRTFPSSTAHVQSAESAV